jgi:hypothetical protein
VGLKVFEEHFHSSVLPKQAIFFLLATKFHGAIVDKLKVSNILT